MELNLSFDGRGPFHGQLTRALRTAIIDGRLRVRSRLPSSRLLAQDLGIARNTVLAAYEQLRAEGYVEGRVGSGSFVARIVAASKSLPIASTRAPAQTAFMRRARTLGPMAAVRPKIRYNLQYGEPTLNPKITNAWRKELGQAALYTHPGYPRVQGLVELREAVCDYLARRRGINADPDSVLVVNGTQQALSLTAQVLVEKGTGVVMEDPQYFATRRVMTAFGARLTGVPVDEDGLDTSRLPRRAPKLICVTPSHQFPLGSVLSLARRAALLAYAERHQAWILEDDYDGEFRYGSQPLAALRALDVNDRVIYVGTFSKVLMPSLRLGYMILPQALKEDFLLAKRLSDFGSPAIEQAAAARFVSSGSFERHLRLSSRLLKARRSALLDALRRHGGKQVEVRDSEAGMHLVAWLKGYDAKRLERLVALARERGLGLHPIAPLYLRAPAACGFLMGYASLSVAELQAAMAIFGTCLRDCAP
jgi:GntR family transcriptional regulator / MocR family aminotransferase